MNIVDCGEGVVLRGFAGKDAQALFDLVQSNREHLGRWISWADSIDSVESAHAFILESADLRASAEAYTHGIWFRGHIAGVLVIGSIDAINRRAALSYWLGQEFVGGGIMTRACAAALRQAFVDCALNRLEISVAEDNVKSLAVPIRLGFRREGALREVEWRDVRFVDHVIFGLLAREWLTIQETHLGSKVPDNG